MLMEDLFTNPLPARDHEAAMIPAAQPYEADPQLQPNDCNLSLLFLFL